MPYLQQGKSENQTEFSAEWEVWAADQTHIKWQLISEKMNVCFWTVCLQSTSWACLNIITRNVYVLVWCVTLFLNKGATSFWKNGHRSFGFAFLRTSPLSSAYHLCGATQTRHRRPLCTTDLHTATGRGLQGVPFSFQLNTKVLSYCKQRRLLTLVQY